MLKNHRRKQTVWKGTNAVKGPCVGHCVQQIKSTEKRLLVCLNNFTKVLGKKV